MASSVAGIVLGITLMIVVPVLAVAGVATLAVTLWHRAKMKKLEIEEKERQAEEDRQILGLGSNDGLSAHLEPILDRLNSIERRLDYLEAVGNIRTKQGTAVPISGPDVATQRRDQTQQQQ
jgi:tetrahydromethanopterin S-methyltransferase subunit G